MKYKKKKSFQNVFLIIIRRTVRGSYYWTMLALQHVTRFVHDYGF